MKFEDSDYTKHKRLFIVIFFICSIGQSQNIGSQISKREQFSRNHEKQYLSSANAILNQDAESNYKDDFLRQSGLLTHEKIMKKKFETSPFNNATAKINSSVKSYFFVPSNTVCNDNSDEKVKILVLKKLKIKQENSTSCFIQHFKKSVLSGISCEFENNERLREINLCENKNRLKLMHGTMAENILTKLQLSKIHPSYFSLIFSCKAIEKILLSKINHKKREIFKVYLVFSKKTKKFRAVNDHYNKQTLNFENFSFCTNIIAIFICCKNKNSNVSVFGGVVRKGTKTGRQYKPRKQTSEVTKQKSAYFEKIKNGVTDSMKNILHFIDKKKTSRNTEYPDYLKEVNCQYEGKCFFAEYNYFNERQTGKNVKKMKVYPKGNHQMTDGKMLNEHLVFGYCCYDDKVDKLIGCNFDKVHKFVDNEHFQCFMRINIKENNISCRSMFLRKLIGTLGRQKSHDHLDSVSCVMIDGDCDRAIYKERFSYAVVGNYNKQFKNVFMPKKSEKCKNKRKNIEKNSKLVSSFIAAIYSNSKRYKKVKTDEIKKMNKDISTVTNKTFGYKNRKKRHIMKKSCSSDKCSNRGVCRVTYGKHTKNMNNTFKLNTDIYLKKKENFETREDGENYLKSSICECFEDFQGEFCEVESPCNFRDKKCYNDGQCVLIHDDAVSYIETFSNKKNISFAIQEKSVNEARKRFECRCLKGYTGSKCELFNPCLLEDICNFNGICLVSLYSKIEVNI